MAADIVARLRGVNEDDAYAHPWTFGETCREGADKIEQLEKEREEIEGAAAENGRWLCARAEAAEASLAQVTKERDEARAALERVAAWIQYKLPIPTYAATTMLGVVLTALNPKAPT